MNFAKFSKISGQRGQESVGMKASFHIAAFLGAVVVRVHTLFVTLQAF
jgi:hypothetical protein